MPQPGCVQARLAQLELSTVGGAFTEVLPGMGMGMQLPGMSGLELMEKIFDDHPLATVILLTAYGTVEDAVKAMKKGAFYYLTKPVNLEELEFLVKKALSDKKMSLIPTRHAGSARVSAPAYCRPFQAPAGITCWRVDPGTTCRASHPMTRQSGAGGRQTS